MTTEPTPQRLEVQDIAAVVRTWDTRHVNKYLACEWIVTAIVKRQDGPESYALDYHLGWPRQLGEPKHPDLSTDTWVKEMLGSGHGDDEKVPF